MVCLADMSIHGCIVRLYHSASFLRSFLLLLIATISRPMDSLSSPEEIARQSQWL